LILASISVEGDLLFCGPLFVKPVSAQNGDHRHRADSGMTQSVPPKRLG